MAFSYKDYRKKGLGSKQEMTLDGMEFIRRFSLHIMPKGFVRIRHYGILSSSSKNTTIPSIKEQARQKTEPEPEPRVLALFYPLMCPCCKTQTMVKMEIFHKRGPPPYTRNKVWENAKRKV